jgi:hypothetical protein
MVADASTLLTFWKPLQRYRDTIEREAQGALGRLRAMHDLPPATADHAAPSPER